MIPILKKDETQKYISNKLIFHLFNFDIIDYSHMYNRNKLI